MPETASTLSEASRRVGRFALDRKIGEGAVGAVYAGVDETTGARVAVKILTANPAEDQDAFNRVSREVGALEKIRHPNVAQLLDFGVAEDGRSYLVFELVEGHTLLELIEAHRRIEPLAAIDWMIQAAEALEEAWKSHIIHRDLKPGNIMIGERGELKLVDFGLAKALHQDVDITAEKMLLGTPRYMSPEAGLGQSLDFRSDMYSLGATFYHLVVGQAPFDAPSPVAMMMKHVSAPLPPARSIDPEIPHDIESVLAVLLAKDPSRRYPNYHDLIADLREVRMALTARRRTESKEEKSMIGDPSALDPRSENYASEPSPEIPEPSTREVHPDRAARALSVVIETRDPHQESRARVIVIIGMIVLGIAGGLRIKMSMTRVETDGRTQTSSIARRLAAWPLFKAHASPEREFEAAADRTKERMESIMSATIRHYESHGAYPNEIGDLITEGIVDRAAAVDAWGHEFRFYKLPCTLRSAGADGAMETDDDFVLDRQMLFTAAPEGYSPSP